MENNLKIIDKIKSLNKITISSNNLKEEINRLCIKIKKTINLIIKS